MEINQDSQREGILDYIPESEAESAALQVHDTEIDMIIDGNEEGDIGTEMGDEFPEESLPMKSTNVRFKISVSKLELLTCEPFKQNEHTKNMTTVPRDPEGDRIDGTQENDSETDLKASQLPKPGSLDDISHQAPLNSVPPAVPHDSMLLEEIPNAIQYEDIDLDELSALAKLNHIKQAMEFIHALEGASLDDGVSKLDPEALHCLRHPLTCSAEIMSPDLHLGLDLFLSTINSSQQTYTSA